MVKVSVIMPAYNAVDYIEKSVKSVMEQTLKDIELVIVNDASTDSTWEKILELKNTYGDKIKAINLEKNVRQGGARNVGIKFSGGGYIVFVDSDDWIKEDMLEKFYNAITENNADMAGSSGYYLHYSLENIHEHNAHDAMSIEISGKTLDNGVKEKFFLSVGGLWRNIYRKDIIINNEIWFPERVSYEDNYFVNLYKGYVNKYVYVDETFYYYRQNPTSTVHRKDMTQLQRVEIEKRLLEEYKKRGLYDAVKDEYDIMTIKRWYINTIFVIFSRFGKEGIQIAKDVKKEFLTYYPDYRKNKYYKHHVPKAHRMMIRMFELIPHLAYTMFQIKLKIKG